jgi:probable selenium-dependent hydroxylase accessory protein YqeC
VNPYKGALGELNKAVFGRPGTGNAAIAAFVGAGGKTSSLFALARYRASLGARVLVSTTTRILDPEAGSGRQGRGFGPVLRLGDLSDPWSLEAIRAAGPRLVLGASEPFRAAEAQKGEGPKLYGIDPLCFAALRELFDSVLIEADGARGLSIKAPAAHEPVIPPLATAVVGLVGLDALGAPMDARIVHRPELFGPLVGCATGAPITIEHVARLAAAPQGLFKGAPMGAARIILLNKAELLAPYDAELCASTLRASAAADAVILGSFGAEEGMA